MAGLPIQEGCIHVMGSGYNGFLRSGPYHLVVPSDKVFDPAVHLAYAEFRIDSQVCYRSG